MSILPVYETLKTIALTEFSDIVSSAEIFTLPSGDPLKLRLEIVDGSFVDVFISVRGRYSYHWDRRLIKPEELYRHDNAPHKRWKHVRTFPKHFHDGTEENVVESNISDNPTIAIREFLSFICQKLHQEVGH